MVSRVVVPCPGAESTSTVPPIFSRLVLTTSMPTPRPETLVTAAAVEKPRRKIRPRMSRSLMRRSCSAVTSPRSTAFAATFAGSIPAPSSITSTTTWPPWWYARRRSVPVAGFPAATRASGFSIPWSTELRTMCVSGSLTASRSVRSSSVSRPSMIRLTCLPQWAPRSRTTRGSFDHRWSICCMRVFITPSCSSLAMRLSRCVARVRSRSSSVEECCTIWLRVSTSSPTSVISESSRSTSTRMLLSATLRRDWVSQASAAASWCSAAEAAAATATGTGSSVTRSCRSSSASSASSAAVSLDGASTAAGARCSSATGAGAADADGRPSRTAVSRSTTASMSTSSPSSPFASMAARSERTVSTMASSTSVISGEVCILPSRSRLRRFSPTWVTASRRLNARKPLVPLIV